MKQIYKLIFIALLLLGLCVSGVQATITEYPYGVNTTLSTNGNAHPEYAFDHINATIFDGVVVSSYTWVKTDFGAGNSHIINEIFLKAGEYGSPYAGPSGQLMGSNDDASWTLIGYWNFSLLNGNSRNVSFTNTNSYRYYKFDNLAGSSGECIYSEMNLLYFTGTPVSLFSSVNVSPVTNTTSQGWSGFTPFEMNFTDSSSNNPTSGNYTVIGYGTNTTTNTINAFDTRITFLPGNFTVTHGVSNAYGSSISPPLWINVTTTAPIANFSGSPVSGLYPLSVKFTDSSSSNPTSWLWDFGDGNNTGNTEQNPEHLYTTAGPFNVNLTATNGYGSDYEYKASYITVYWPVTSSFSLFNAAGTAPHTTYLYDTSTNLTPGPVTYLTDFGDGNTSEEANLFYTSNITGEYNVTHTVSNGLSSETSFTTVTVGTPTPPVVAPVASFYGSPTTGNVPLTVFFTDVSSNTPTSWFWEFGDGSNSTLQNPQHQYTSSGFKTVSLNVTNSAGSNITVRVKFVKVS